MELSDFWGVVNSYIDNGDNGVGFNEPRIKSSTKLISINSVELNTKANYQDFQRFLTIDVSMPADAEATLPALIDAVKSASLSRLPAGDALPITTDIDRGGVLAQSCKNDL